MYTKGRRIPTVVDGEFNKKKAIKHALKKVKKRGSNKVDKIRRLTDKEQIKADKGEWVKGHNIDKERKNLRGRGPKPKNFEFSQTTKINRFRRDGKWVKAHTRKIDKERKATDGDWRVAAGLVAGAALYGGLKNRKSIGNFINQQKYNIYKKKASKMLPAAKLGEGAYGRVDDTGLGQAAKAIFLDTSDPTPGYRKIQDINEEFRKLKRLAKSGVTPKPGKNYGGVFTMEKFSGKTLYDSIDEKLKAKTLKDSELDELAKKTAKSIKAFHSKGFTHNDLHGNNLLLDSKGDIKIIDLGLAKKEKFNSSSKKLAANITDLDRLATKGLFNPNTPGAREARDKFRAKLKSYYFDPTFSRFLVEFSKSNNYTKPELRERLKNEIKNSSKGGKSGQWSARKSQILARKYKEKGGGYKGGKEKAQKSLSKWTKQKWQASDGGNSRRTTKSGKTITKKYLPEKAWSKLDSKEKQSLNRSKAKAEKKGKQFSKAPKKLSKKVSEYWKYRNSLSNQARTIDFKAKLVDAAIKVGAHRRAGKWVQGFKRTQQVRKSLNRAKKIRQGDAKGLAQDVAVDALVDRGLVDSKKALRKYGQNNSDTIVGQFLGQGELPGRRQSAKIVKDRLAKAAKNTKKVIEDGFEKERLFLEGVSKLVGRPVTKGEIIRKGTNAAVNRFGSEIKEIVNDPKKLLDSDLAENALINTGGLIGSIAGGAAGPAVALAGDLSGARVVRRGLIDTKSLIEAYQQRNNLPKLSPEFGVNERLQRFGQIMDDAKQRAESKIKETKTAGLADDVGGWAVGNAVGTGLLGGSIPGAGMGPGIVGSMTAQAVEKRMRETGEDFVTASQQIIASRIKSGNKREEQLREQTRQIWTNLLES